MNKRVKIILKYILFLGLGVFFAWLSLKDLNREKYHQIREAFLSARQWLIFPVLFVLFSSHFIRALRWRLLIGSLGYHTSRRNAFFAVLIGYLVNMGVPRFGEVVRCTVLARTEKIPADKLIGTVILERMIDALSLLLVFGITLAIQPGLYTQITDALFNQNAATPGKKIPGWLIPAIVFGVLLILLLVWMWVRKKNLRDLGAIIRRIIKSILQGISSVKHLKKRKQFILLTLLLWSAYLLGGYLGFHAFRQTEQYGIREAFTILSAGSIGMIASPGGIGAYALLIEKVMQLYGLSYAMATAFGWLLWMVQTLVILVGGIISFVAIPYFNRKKTV